MSISVTKRIAVALLSGAVVLGGMTAPSAAAGYRHGGGGFHGGHGGYRGHYAGGYRRHGYYGGGYYGGGYYGPPCVPLLGLVSGNYCNGYYY
jgi:uncharacterized membrane protein